MPDELDDEIKRQAREAVQPMQSPGPGVMRPPIAPDLEQLDISTVTDFSPKDERPPGNMADVLKDLGITIQERGEDQREIDHDIDR